MSWCPFAKKMELQPESDAQAAIRPTQFIVHSLAAPWTIERIYEFWLKSTNLESHFGIGYDGRIGQYIGTQTRADANASANVRAISVETAANTKNTDPWNPAQINSLVRLMDWAAEEHGIPRRVCRSGADPGFGYHRLHSAWSMGGTYCPGDKRVAQFKKIVMPRVIAGDVKVDDVALTADDINKIANAVVGKLIAGGGVLEDGDVRRIFTTDGILAAPPDSSTASTNPHWTFGSHVQAQTTTVRATAEDVGALLIRANSNGAVLDSIKKAVDELKAGKA